jgi:hypothetical protein
MHKTIFTSAVMGTVLTLSACATLDSARSPDAHVKDLHSFYVAQEKDDDNGIDKLIAARLSTLGYLASYGASPKPPEQVDAIITYQDRWTWDITMYMVKLDMQIHDGESGATIARAQSVRPSLQRKSPEGMVQEVLGEILK